MDLEGDAWALRNDVAAVWLDHDVVRVQGAEAESFLQGQLSQDVAGLAPGAAAWSFLLQPTGKVDALLRVVRSAPECFLLHTDTGHGEAVVERLERFKLRVKADVERLPAWRVLAVRGPKAGDHRPEPGPGTEVVADASDVHVPGFDAVGPEPLVPSGVPEAGHEAYEALRIELGLPRMGAEITERTIPAETGMVDRAASFTKGCYTGQELVARIDSRGGNVPRRLRGVVISTNVLPPVGADVVVGGQAVGELTSVAESMAVRAPVALAYVKRGVDPPAEAVVRWEGGEVTARIEALPLTAAAPPVS